MKIDTKNPIRLAATVALFAAVTAVTAGAQAADAPQLHVKYADLNLNTKAGATVLYQRIHGAADQVCGVAEARDLARLGQARQCADHAVAEAVATVNAPALLAVYEVKMGDTPATRLATAR